MLPLIEAEVVTKQKWIDPEEFLEMLVLAQTSPGPVVVNLANQVGRKLKGGIGAWWSIFGAIIPSFVIILTFATFLAKFQDSPIMLHLFKGIRPAVVAMILVPVFSLAKSAKLSLKTLWIPILAAFLIKFLHVSPVYIILFSALGGILYVRIRGEKVLADQKKSKASKEASKSNESHKS